MNVTHAACTAGARITVIGAVQRPGTFACRAGMRLTDAVGAAGGLTPIAWSNGTRLERAHRVYRVPLGVIVDGGAPDPLLAPDDVIVIEVRDV